MTNLLDMSFSELMDVSKEDFDIILANDTNNVGFYMSLRNLLSMQYDKMAEAVAELSTKDDPEYVKVREQMIAMMLKTEYKAIKIHEKEKSLHKEITDRTV